MSDDGGGGDSGGGGGDTGGGCDSGGGGGGYSCDYSSNNDYSSNVETNNDCSGIGSTLSAIESAVDFTSVVESTKSAIADDHSSDVREDNSGLGTDIATLQNAANLINEGQSMRAAFNNDNYSSTELQFDDIPARDNHLGVGRTNLNHTTYHVPSSGNYIRGGARPRRPGIWNVISGRDISETSDPPCSCCRTVKCGVITFVVVFILAIVFIIIYRTGTSTKSTTYQT